MARQPKTTAADRQLVLAAGELGGATTTLNYTTHIATEKPDYTSLVSIYDRCRYFARESSFLKMFLPLKRSVYNYGLSIVAADPAQQDALEEWLDQDSEVLVDKFVDPSTQETVTVESTTTNREIVEKWIEDAWTNFILFDADIATWQDDVQGAVSLALERCQYTDTMGLEMVKYTHGLSRQQLQQLSKESQKIFEKPTIILNPKNKMHFKVLKRAARGEGLPVPNLFSAFRLFGEIESKEFGQHALAFGLRSVKRVHKIGHEIKNGQHAGKPHHFYKTPRATAIKRNWVDLIGFEDYVCNFDETIEYWLPDPKLFDTVIWKGTNDRLTQWAGPIGQMLVAKGVMPYLSNVLKAVVADDREKFGRYAASVVSRAFGAPGPVRLSFSNAIFSESRLAAEMTKFAVQNGLVSWTTGTQEAGFSPEVEQNRKVTEADDDDAMKKFAPMYAAAQASMPALGETAGKMAEQRSSQPAQPGAKPKGQAPGATPGRKPGSPNEMPTVS